MTTPAAGTKAAKASTATPQKSASPNGPSASTAATSPSSSPEDLKLLKYVREHSQRIVNALSYTASRSGDQGHWPEMQETMAVANRMSVLCGLGSLPAAVTAPKAMAQAAGAGQ